MVTNEMLCGVAKSASTFDALFMADWGRSPFWQFAAPATFAACITIVWLAAANLRSLLDRDRLPKDLKAIHCRLAVSRYMLLFFAAVWLLIAAASLTWLVSSLTAMEGGEARTAMLRSNAEPPFIWAIILVVLTGIHSAVGIVFEIKKKKYEE